MLALISIWHKPRMDKFAFNVNLVLVSTNICILLLRFFHFVPLIIDIQQKCCFTIHLMDLIGIKKWKERSRTLPIIGTAYMDI